MTGRHAERAPSLLQYVAVRKLVQGNRNLREHQRAEHDGPETA
jgi:hypothetical protein